METDAGTLIHGWRIGEIPGLFIEGEFHGIWLSPSGQHLDITPGEDKQILFLPDPSITFDEVTFTRRDNIRMALIDHPAVHTFIAHCEELFRYEESGTIPSDPRRFTVNEARHSWYMERKAQLQVQIASIPCGRNDPCRCGSGLKFKKCCCKHNA